MVRESFSTHIVCTVILTVSWAVALTMVHPAWAEGSKANSPFAEPVYRAVEVRRLCHDASAFTEGLLCYKGKLMESTGRYGRSLLREIDAVTGEPLRTVRLENGLFGEGIAVVGGKLFQLTWREETALVYDADTLVISGRRRYSGEGWGLTSDGRYLIMSNGTDVIKFIDPETFKTVRTLRVRSRSRGALYFLNELEYIDGEIWANIWNSAEIVRIDPGDGSVKAWVELGGLVMEDSRDSHQVFNGIAWNSKDQKLFIALKLWPWIYEVRLVPLASFQR